MPRARAAWAISRTDRRPSDQVVCMCRSASQVAICTSVRQRARLRRLDLAAIFAQQRGDIGQAERGVDFFFGGAENFRRRHSGA